MISCKAWRAMISWILPCPIQGAPSGPLWLSTRASLWSRGVVCFLTLLGTFGIYGISFLIPFSLPFIFVLLHTTSPWLLRRWFDEWHHIVTAWALHFLRLCRDPSLRDTWHASYSDTWHALSSGSPSSGSFYKAHMTRFSHPDCLKEEQTTLTKHRHPDGFHKCVCSTIHLDNQHGLSRYDCPDHWLK